MGHITHQSQRDENDAINNCYYSSMKVYREVSRDWDDNPVMGWITENRCGETTYISTAQDRCNRCGKVFTY